MTKKNYTKPELRNRIKSQVMASGDGGKPGQWSARKAQLVAQKYEAAGGGYKGPRTGAQKSLAKWTDQKWTTSDGKPAEKPDGTMRRYLPEKAWDKLSPGQKAATNKKKVEASRKGQQFVSNTPAAQEARKEAAEYTEGPESTFTHNKKRHSVDAAIAASKQRPVVEVPVRDLAWILKHSKPQADRVRAADPTVPVLITKWGDKDVVVDGLHRLQKAQDIKQNTILTRRLSAADLRKVQVDAMPHTEARVKSSAFFEEVKLALLAKHKNPEGGLTEAGRRHFERSGESGDLKPGVKKPADEMSVQDMKRKGSWARRFYGQNPLPPLKKPNGEPTRLALTAKAWGEPVPQNEQQARAIAAKGARLLETAKRREGEKSAQIAPHAFAGFAREAAILANQEAPAEIDELDASSPYRDSALHKAVGSEQSRMNPVDKPPRADFARAPARTLRSV
jgi:hypothetical protein